MYSTKSLSLFVFCAVLLAQAALAHQQQSVRSIHSSPAKRHQINRRQPTWHSSSWGSSYSSSTLNGVTSGSGESTSFQASSFDPDGNKSSKTWSFGPHAGSDDSPKNSFFGSTNRPDLANILNGMDHEGASGLKQQQQKQQQDNYEQEESKDESKTNNNNKANSKTTSGKTNDSWENSSSSSSSSASHSSYSFASSSFYSVTSQQQLAAPFQPYSKLEWNSSNSRKSSKSSSSGGSVNVNGFSIPRPAPAKTCNNKFPYQSQPGDGDSGKKEKFLAPFTGELDEVHRMALDMHNKERARYGHPALVWNAELADFAACWADLKPYGHSERLFVSTGENIGEGYGDHCYDTPQNAMSSVINGFLDEDRNYAQSKDIAEDTGHVTAIWWKNTQAVGCAVAGRDDFMGGSQAFYVVCSYYPAGNIVSRQEISKNLPSYIKVPSQLRSSCSSNIIHTRK